MTLFYYQFLCFYADNCGYMRPEFKYNVNIYENYDIF